MMYRACALLLALLVAGTAAAQAITTPEPTGWTVYAQRFVRSDGRVSDTGAGGISHSEGQGTALLLAGRAGDRPHFDAIWHWTRANLGVRDDALLAWSWHPDQHPHVPDKNNATDGDLLVAWALAEAWRRWDAPGYHDAALAIGRAIREKLLRSTAIGPVLLPAASGFETPDGLVLNLSYAVLPAFRALQDIDPDPCWPALEAAHHALLAKARFGPFSLPPDWLFLPAQWRPDVASRALSPWSGRPARFGFEAIRIPLYLAWGGVDERELWPFLGFWRHFDGAPTQPAWIDLQDGSVAAYQMPPGFGSVRRLAEAAQGQDWPHVSPAPMSADADYYSASLTMLSALAWHDRGF